MFKYTFCTKTTATLTTWVAYCLKFSIFNKMQLSNMVNCAMCCAILVQGFFKDIKNSKNLQTQQN